MRTFITGILLLILHSAHAIPQRGDTLTLTIVSVNDMHARIDNFPGFISWVDSVRSNSDHVLLLSAGDNFTGNPMVDQNPDKGFPMIEFMNLAGFNAGAIGNHEFDYGQDVLKKRMEQAEFPMLSANIVSGEESEIKFKPWFLKTIDGVKIGIFSMVQVNDEGIPDTHPSKLKGLTFIPPLDYLPSLKAMADSCDVVIALTHLGLETDTELADAWGRIDLITGGHSHTLITNPPTQNGVLITQAGAGLKYATVATLKIVNGVVVEKSAKVVDLATHYGRNAIADSVLVLFNDIKGLKQTVGSAAEAISGPDELGALTTDAIAAVEPIELAFQNKGGIRMQRLEKGEITIKDVYTLDPFGNEIIMFKLIPAEIRSLLLNAYNREKSIDLIPSGVNYTIITNAQNDGIGVDLYLPDGSVPDENRVFNVGVSSYVASSYTFDHKDEGSSLFIITAQSLINFMQDKKTVNYSGIKRTGVKMQEN